MASKTGLSSIDDLLEVRFKSATETGLNVIEPILQRDLAIHNRIVTQMIGATSEITTDRRRIYGVADELTMIEADEFSRAATQKVVTGAVVEFPLRGFQEALGWNQAFFDNKSTADMASVQVAAKRGHLSQIKRQYQRAVYMAANYTFVDYRTDKVSLAVKRFLNADGAIIPNGPNNETFNGSSHTHYLATAALAASDLTALIATVLEHHNGGKIVVEIAQAQEAAVRALTGFVAYVDSRLTLNTAANQPTDRLNVMMTNNRAIGLFGAAEVWVKPAAIANYIYCYDAAPTAPKGVVARVRSGGSITLKTAAQNALFPLYAEFMESEFGFGVWTRTNGAVLYTGGGAYTDPTL